MENSLQRMKELVEKLDQAAKAYYQEDREIMSNQEYDSLYDQLEQLEKETGTVLTNSPTVRVAVSYTHLDVYKRQSRYWHAVSGCLRMA